MNKLRDNAPKTHTHILGKMKKKYSATNNSSNNNNKTRNRSGSNTEKKSEEKKALKRIVFFPNEFYSVLSGSAFLRCLFRWSFLAGLLIHCGWCWMKQVSCFILHVIWNNFFHSLIHFDEMREWERWTFGCLSFIFRYFN